MSCQLTEFVKKSNIRFDSEFEVEGDWWLPENQDNEVSGKLSYSIADGIKLKIKYANKIFSKPDENDLEIINGMLTCGLQVSLLKCLKIHDDNQIKFLPDFHKQTTQIFHISKAFFGTHFKEKEISQFDFKKMKLNFTYLDWFRYNDVKLKQMKIDNSNNYKLTDKYSIEIENIRTEISYIQIFKTLCSESLTHDSKPSVSIAPETKASFDWFLKVISDLENFLSLVSDVYVQRTQVLFYINDNDYVSFLHQLSFPVDKKKKLDDIRSKKIQFEPIKEQLGDIMRSWFKKSNELRSVFDLFFSVRMHPRLYEQSKFIHLMQALEIFLRKTNPSVLLSEKEFKEFKNIVTKTIQGSKVNKEFKNSVLQKLEYWNEPSLREKLKKVMLSLEDHLKEQLIYPFKEEDKEKNKEKLEKLFVNDIVDIRNKLTHHSSYSDSLLERKALRYYAEKLFILLSYLILIEVGFPKDLVSKNLRHERIL